MNLRIDFDCIFLNEIASCFVVALALNALDFTEKLTYQLTHALVVVDAYVGLSVDSYILYHIVGLAVLKHPFGNQFAVAHVGLFYILAGLDSHELSHESVKHILVVLSLVSVGVVEKTKLNQFGIGKII